MRSRILEIVVFLMDLMRDNQDQLSDGDDFSDALEDMGYSEQEIDTAYNWLMEQFNGVPQKFFSEFPKSHSSQRVLTARERMHITPEAYGFLLKLLQGALITGEQLESIIERATFFDSEQVTLEQMKFISSSVVFKDNDEVDHLGLLDVRNDRFNSVN